MKKIAALLIATAVLPNLASATITRLTSYNELLTALKNGHRVNAVIDNSKCKVTESIKSHSKIKSPDLNAIVGLSFNTNFFLMYRDEGDPRNYLVTIATNTLGNMGKGPRIRYKRVKVYDDNSAEFYASLSDFNTGKATDYSTAICAMSNGNDQNGLSLFDYDVA